MPKPSTIKKTARNNDAGSSSAEILRAKRIIRGQIVLAVCSLVVVVVMIFAMTSAWYTNVSKSTSLVFTTDVWGFDAASISVSEDQIVIAPGMHGIVPLQVENTAGGSSINVDVTISKSVMNDDELRKRIFFYADSSAVLNQESVSRIYLGSTEENHYSYTLLPGRNLIFSEDYYNDVPIKWEWVYDMLGYYFRGVIQEETVSIQEYIRPIEYDYENAIFDIVGENQTGALISVGGVAAADLVSALSASDGFAGTVDPEEAIVVGSRVYYPVSANEDGSGIWAYLCSYGEIEQGILYDSSITQGTMVNANITISVSNRPLRTEQADSPADLLVALFSDNVDVIELTDSIELESPVVLTGSVDSVIDMRGFDITYTGTTSTYSLFSMNEGSSLTIMNGNVLGNDMNSGVSGRVSSVAFESVGGDLTLSNVNVSGFDSAIYVADMTGNGSDSVIRIYGCELVTENPTIFIMGNGSGSDTPTQVIIQDSIVSSNYLGISGQGSTNRWGTDIVIMNSSIYGYYAALYQPQQKATTLISHSEMTGITGIAIKGGSVTVADSTVTGTGAYTAARFSASGWTDTGDGIYLEGGYTWDAAVVVKGESIVTSENAYAVELFGKEGTGNDRILIYDGIFSGGMGDANFNNIGTFHIYGGSFEGTVQEDIIRYDVQENRP